MRLTLLVIGLVACGTEGVELGRLEARDAAPDADGTSVRDASADPGDGGVPSSLPDAAVTCATSPCFIALATGNGVASGVVQGGHYCALDAQHHVWCWGANPFGQVGGAPAPDPDAGLDTDEKVARPRLVVRLAAVTQVSVGAEGSCARLDDGGVSCWGSRRFVEAAVVPVDGGGALPERVTEPTPATALERAKRVDLGGGSGCIVTETSELVCWGENARGQLGRGVTSSAFERPARPYGVKGAFAFAQPGPYGVFAVTANGEVWSWGAAGLDSPDQWLLGRDSSELVDPWPLATGVSGVRAVSAGDYHSCALRGLAVTCWGIHRGPQLARPGVWGQGYPPLDAALDSSVVPVAVATSGQNGAATCVVESDGSIVCFGSNHKGQLGRSIPYIPGSEVAGPGKVVGLDGPAVGIASAGNSFCALLRSGAVQCWGTNAFGELGRGTTDYERHIEPAHVRF